MTKSFLKELTYEVIGAAIEVHHQLGPGLLESVYHRCLEQEFKIRGVSFASQLKTPIIFKGIEMNSELRCDFLVKDALVVEIKSIEGILPVHKAQLLTYMSLLGKPKGIIINFNCTNIFHEGQITIVNRLFAGLPDA